MHLASHKRVKYPDVKDYSDVFLLSRICQEDKKYGSVTEDFESLHARSMQLINYLAASSCPVGSRKRPLTHEDASSHPPHESAQAMDVIDVEEEKAPENRSGYDITSAIQLDSDDEGKPSCQDMETPTLERLRIMREMLQSELAARIRRNRFPNGTANLLLQLPNDQGICIEGKKPHSVQYEKVVLKKVTEEQLAPNLEFMQDQSLVVRRDSGGLDSVLNSQKVMHDQSLVIRSDRESGGLDSVKIQKTLKPEIVRHKKEANALALKVNVEKETVFNSSLSLKDEDHYSPNMMTYHEESKTPESDGLEDLWTDMSVAMECSKDARQTDESSFVHEEEEEECAHSFLLQDDLGLVCRVCGVIQKRIETIFDYQWAKAPQSTRTYVPGSRNSNLGDLADSSTTNIAEHSLIVSDISIHPRHMKQMKSHQIEGFNFLVKNLLGDPPGGCILAHAPGSGKTFMLISFIQSFMAKDPSARPLVVLPKGILDTWKKEFQRWQVEDIPMYDFYSLKTCQDNRLQQLGVLNKWQDNRSILLLGYTQFANIICEGGNNKATAACQEKLLKIPTLLILDEGHTPRNDKTNMVDALAKVRTPCKVVLSGTLFQNHVGEVFNILKLVRPNFMKTESSRTIIKRILSRVHISGGRKPTKSNQESYFCELVEDTLRNDDNYKRKTAVIQELRDMTRNVLHYYKGDFLDELPGLVDFTVLLDLGVKQKEAIKKLGKLDKFKRSSLEKAIYVHPRLMELRDSVSGEKDANIDVQKVDVVVESLNVREGAKAKFFLNLLSMAESHREKVLVFSQYLLPLKFLELLASRVKGWRTGKEIFVISGDTAREDRERSMDQFNNSHDAKVFFGSIKACGEGISLVGASRVVILDVHINPSVTRQAIGRTFRPGQEKKVYVYRLVAADSVEEDDHITAFRKETISKMWFEWDQLYRHQDFELDAIDMEDSQDLFFDNPALREDVKTLYIR